MNKIEIFTDGSGTSANKPGGWAFVAVINDKKANERSGRMENASNNDAEIEAALQGLAWLKQHFDTYQTNPADFEIYLVSDSQLILGWATGTYRVKDQTKLDRVNKLKHLVNLMMVRTRWVKGHSGDEFNTRCDKLARQARIESTDSKESNLTKIGEKRAGTIALWHKDKLHVIDLDNMVIEVYNKSLHGHRSSNLEVK